MQGNMLLLLCLNKFSEFVSFEACTAERFRVPLFWGITQ
jgi:hypothetical protein